MVSGASGAARSQEAQSWKGPNTIGTRERAWQKRQKTRRDMQRLAAPCSAGRAGAHRPSEALHPTRSSDVLSRIARERVPTVPRVAKNASKCATAPGLLRRDAVYTNGSNQVRPCSGPFGKRRKSMIFVLPHDDTYNQRPYPA